MSEQVTPKGFENTGKQELSLKAPSSEVTFQLMGYSALNDLRTDPSGSLLGLEKDSLASSDNPLSKRILEASNENRSTQNSASAWGLESDFWELMVVTVSTGHFDDFEKSYLQWLDKRFSKVNQNVLPVSAQDALGKLFDKNPQLYVKLLQASLDIRQQRISNQWKHSDYRSDFFERSLQDWAKKNPVICMSFVLNNQTKVSNEGQWLVLLEVLKADREYGWSIAERFLHSPRGSDRAAAYRLIEDDTLQVMEQSKTPREFIDLYEKTLEHFLESTELDSGSMLSSEYFDFVILGSELNLYLAACEASGISPHSLVNGIEQKVFATNQYKERWLQQTAFEEKQGIPDIFLMTNRLDIYFAKDRPVSMFTTEGKSRLYRIGKCLANERGKTNPNSSVIQQLTHEAQKIVNRGLDDPQMMQTDEVVKIKEAVDSGDRSKRKHSLNRLPVYALFSNIDPRIGAVALSRFIDLNLMPRNIIIEHFERELVSLLKVDPREYLRLTEGVTLYSTERVRDRFEKNRAEARWRLKYQDDYAATWEASKKVLTEDGAPWTDIVGALKTLGAVFAHQPNEAFVIISDLVTKQEYWLKSRTEHVMANLPKDKEVDEWDLKFAVSNLFAEAIEKAAQELAQQERVDFIVRTYELGNTESILKYFSPEKALGDLSVEHKKELATNLHPIELQRNAHRTPINADDTANEVEMSTQSILNEVVSEDPRFVLEFLSKHKMPVKLDSRQFINKLVIGSLAALPTSSEVRTFDQKILSLTEKYGLQYHDSFVSLVSAYSTQTPEKQIVTYERIRTRLRSINEQLDESKKTADTEQFVKDNQNRIAKLELLYPNPVYASSLITETAQQHGFQRLQSRLELLDAISLKDIVTLHELLSKRQPALMNQSLLGDLLSLYSTYQAINAKSKFFETVYQNVNSPVLIQEMGQKLMEEFAQSIGIDPTQLPSGAIAVWNFDYIPKLFEAASRFNEIDEKIFTLIVKSTMLGDFDQLINPDGQLDIPKYTETERILIDEIRNHNRLTQERFEKRNISLESFKNGTQERRIKGVVTSEQIVTRTYNKISHQIMHTFEEAEGLIDISSLNEDRSKAEYQLSVSVDSLLTFMAEVKQTETASQLEPHTTLTSWEQVIRTILGTGKTAEGALLGQETAVKIRSGNFLRAFTWKEGKLVGLTPDASAITHRIRTLQEELDKAATIFPEKVDDINQVRQQLSDLQTQLPKSGKPTKRSPNKSQRPSIKENTLLMTDVLDKALGIVDDKIDHPEDHPEQLDALKLLKDHLLSRKSDLEKFIFLAQEAKDTTYDLTLRRWRRLPGQDIFQGNYSSCCVAIDGMNGFAMLKYLTGYDIQLTEVVDTQTNESLGQTFEFLSENRDGAISYTIDNCELAARITVASDVIRDNLFEMAIETAKSMKIDSNLPGVSDVVMGVSYNDVDIDHLPRKNRRIRKVGGVSLGLKQYLDVFVDHKPGPGVKVLHPNTYHELPVAEVAKIEEYQPPQQPEIHLETRLANESDWTEIAHDILRLEKDMFSLMADTPETLQREFSNENNIAIIARDETGKMIGYTLGLDQGEATIEEETGKMLYITSSVVDYDIASSGVNSKMQAVLNSEAKRRGFNFIARTTMADNGYAQRIIRTASEEGTLITPKSLQNIQYTHFYGRPQIYIVTRIK